jgi:hypothetical protein
MLRHPVRLARILLDRLRGGGGLLQLCLGAGGRRSRI